MAHSYTFETPAVSLDQDIISFFQSFYAISDTPGNHPTYVDQFAEDATFIVAGKKNQGHSGNLPSASRLIYEQYRKQLTMKI